MSIKTFPKRSARSSEDTKSIKAKSLKRKTISAVDNVSISTMVKTCQLLFKSNASVRRIKTVVTFSK